MIIQQCRKCGVYFRSERLLLICQIATCDGFMSIQLPESVLEGAVKFQEKDLRHGI